MIRKDRLQYKITGTHMNYQGRYILSGQICSGYGHNEGKKSVEIRVVNI